MRLKRLLILVLLGVLLVLQVVHAVAGVVRAAAAPLPPLAFSNGGTESPRDSAFFTGCILPEVAVAQRHIWRAQA